MGPTDSTLTIITGLGRCGTSALAMYMKELGFDLGDVSFHPDLGAGYELKEAYQINKDLFTDYLQQNREPPMDEFMRRIQAIDVDVVKDPRFTWHPQLLPIWASIRPIRVLFCHRAIEQIIASRIRADKKVDYNFLDPKRGNDADWFKKDFSDCITAILLHKIPFRFLMYPDFTDDFYSVYYAMTELNIWIPETKECFDAWKRVIEPRGTKASNGAHSERAAKG